MLSWMSADNLAHAGSREFGLVPGLNVVCGPVGSGKTMLLKDCLFLLLTGRIPGNRTLESLGKKFRASVSLRGRDGQTLTVVRSGSSVSVMEDPSVTSAAAACERVAAFAGLPSNRLFDLCYVNGITLPGTVLTSSALLGVVRGTAKTEGLQALGKQVNARYKELQQELDVLALHLSAPDDTAAAQAAVEAAKQRLSRAETALASTVSGEAISRQVLECPDPEESRKAIKTLRDKLGKLAEDPQAAAKVDGLACYKFLKGLIDADLALAADRYPGRSFVPGTEDWDDAMGKMPSLVSAYGEALALGDNLLADPDTLRYLLRQYADVSTRKTTTADNRAKAQAFLDYVAALRQEKAEAMRELDVAAVLLEKSQQAAVAKRNGQARKDHLEKICARFKQALELLQPSGKHSVEKEIVEALLSQVLLIATDLLNRCGIDGIMEYSADEGLTLRRGDSRCPSNELSGGELVAVALSLRLVLGLCSEKPPFLVLDDVTGALGRLVPGVCDMLAEYSADTDTPIVLITHDVSARGDHMIQF